MCLKLARVFPEFYPLLKNILLIFILKFLVNLSAYFQQIALTPVPMTPQEGGGVRYFFAPSTLPNTSFAPASFPSKKPMLGLEWERREWSNGTDRRESGTSERRWMDGQDRRDGRRDWNYRNDSAKQRVFISSHRYEQQRRDVSDRRLDGKARNDSRQQPRVFVASNRHPLPNRFGNQ